MIWTFASSIRLFYCSSTWRAWSYTRFCPTRSRSELCLSSLHSINLLAQWSSSRTLLQPASPARAHSSPFVPIKETPRTSYATNDPGQLNKNIELGDPIAVREDSGLWQVSFSNITITCETSKSESYSDPHILNAKDFGHPDVTNVRKGDGILVSGFRSQVSCLSRVMVLWLSFRRSLAW